MVKYNRIGEGTYGCVIEPSLLCKTKQPKGTYRNKISKIMLTRHAKKEMDEYVLISRADQKKEYYLGKPTMCKIKNNAQTRKIIKKCKNSEKYLNDLDETSLLIMENGGINLSMLSDKIEKMKNTQQNRELIKRVLFEISRIFEGIQAFLKHDIVHHDLKPQNIVYNSETDRMNFIDFGLMKRLSTSIQKSRKSTNWITQYAHWSYPLETQFLNRDKYMYFVHKSDAEKEEYIKRLMDNIYRDSNDKFTDAFYALCSYVIDTNITESQANKMRENILYDYIEFILKDMRADNYEEIMKRSFHTYDTYGFGMGISRLVFSSKQLLNAELYDELSGFSYGLVHPNVLKRLTVEDAIRTYDEILKMHF